MLQSSYDVILTRLELFVLLYFSWSFLKFKFQSCSTSSDWTSSEFKTISIFLKPFSRNSLFSEIPCVLFSISKKGFSDPWNFLCRTSCKEGHFTANLDMTITISFSMKCWNFLKRPLRPSGPVICTKYRSATLWCRFPRKYWKAKDWFGGPVLRGGLVPTIYLTATFYCIKPR